MRTITVKLPRTLGERLSRAVVRRRSTQSAIVREALAAYLAAAGAGEGGGGSCFDLSSDLAGSVRGPSDLSSNRSRLKGYGR
jgi:metal-responsive CopG/Arc/MetJ family transcriptional regulator